MNLYLMAGMVLRVIPTVETTTKMNEMKETVWGRIILTIGNRITDQSFLKEQGGRVR